MITIGTCGPPSSVIDYGWNYEQVTFSLQKDSKRNRKEILRILDKEGVGWKE